MRKNGEADLGTVMIFIILILLLSALVIFMLRIVSFINGDVPPLPKVDISNLSTLGEPTNGSTRAQKEQMIKNETINPDELRG